MFLMEFAVHHSKWLIFNVRLYQQNDERTISHDSTHFYHTTLLLLLLAQTNIQKLHRLPLITPGNTIFKVMDFLI